MGYLMAGLPVIVDTYFEYQAELIQEFNAGIIIEPENMNNLAEIIKNTDPTPLRQGVRDLRLYMMNENAKTFAQLQALFT